MPRDAWLRTTGTSRLLKRIPHLAVALLVCLAGVRAAALLDTSPMLPSLANLTLVATENFEVDAQAAAILTPGPDRAPGQLGWDDDANGIIDDDGELGAVHSDDVILTPSDAGYTEASSNGPTRRMFSGVPVISDSDESSIVRMTFLTPELDHRVWRLDRGSSRDLISD